MSGKASQTLLFRCSFLLVFVLWASLGTRLRDLIDFNPILGYKFIGFIAKEESDRSDVLGSIDDLDRLIQEHNIPLSAYDDLSVFKLYLSDSGLLRRLAKLPAASLLSKTSGFVEFKGALAENYILQSLKTQFEVPLRFWTSDRSAEIDFIIQVGSTVLPIEVKSGTNVRGKSLQLYQSKFEPKFRIRYSGLNLSRDANLLNIPLFMSDFTKKFII